MSDSDSETRPSFREWCVLELMGHRRLGGLVTEQELAGTAFVRIDVPADDEGGKPSTQIYSPAAVYCITPTTEEIARAVAKRNRPQPVQRWELAAPPSAQQITPHQQGWEDDDISDDLPL